MLGQLQLKQAQLNVQHLAGCSWPVCWLSKVAVVVPVSSRKHCAAHTAVVSSGGWKCYLEPSSRLLSLRSGRWPRCQLSLSRSLLSEPEEALSGGGMPAKRCTGLMAHKTGLPKHQVFQGNCQSQDEATWAGRQAGSGPAPTGACSQPGAYLVSMLKTRGV